jgi:DMSO/TMAO reductase YedYZ heme-binding membrane subunit
MRFIAGLLIAIIFTAIFRVPLRKVPALFYVVATLLNVFFLLGDYLPLPSWFREYFLFLFQSNVLGMGFFVIVMFIGVFKESFPLRKALIPIRAELSIFASLLSIGHLIKYGQSYLDQMLSLSTFMPPIRYWMIGVAIVLVILLVPLAITSVKRIHAMMGQKSWQRLQRFAYPFFGLIFVHIVLCLWTPAAAGNSSAIFSICAYLAVGLLYAVLRIRLYAVSRQQVEAS